MKIDFDKTIHNGKYHVVIKVAEISQDEKDQMKKFGAPEISIRPRLVLYNAKYVASLPLSDFGGVFSFDSESQASIFIKSIRERISEAVETLKAREDNFSKKETHEF